MQRVHLNGAKRTEIGGGGNLCEYDWAFEAVNFEVELPIGLAGEFCW